MQVEWIEIQPLHKIPEQYWGEDLSQLDRHYEGEVMKIIRTFFGYTYIIVACIDGGIREVEINKVKIKNTIK